MAPDRYRGNTGFESDGDLSSRVSAIVTLMTSSIFCSVSFHTTRRSLQGFEGTSA